MTGVKQMVNHLEFHHIISEKAFLFNELTRYCDGLKENVFDLMVPITFYVEINDLDKPQVYNQVMQPFIQFYQALEDARDRVKSIKDAVKDHKKQKGLNDDGDAGESHGKREKEFLATLNNKKDAGSATQKITKFKTFNFEKRTHTKYSFPLCHFDGFNMWLLKPTHLNRGRGIHVFRDLDTLHKLIKEYCQGKDEEVKVAPKKEQSSPAGCGEDDGCTLDNEEADITTAVL
jgi:Tubulin-tyrosine ligase family